MYLIPIKTDPPTYSLQDEQMKPIHSLSTAFFKKTTIWFMLKFPVLCIKTKCFYEPPDDSLYKEGEKT